MIFKAEYFLTFQNEKHTAEQLVSTRRMLPIRCVPWDTVEFARKQLNTKYGGRFILISCVRTSGGMLKNDN